MSATPKTFTAAPRVSHASPAAELLSVTKRYRNGVTALNNLSLSLYPGEIVALLGPNGAGKSTAVKLLLGICAPTLGRAHIFGQDPRLSTHRIRTGVMLQVGRAPETLRVREHIDLFRGYYPSPLSALELVRLAGLEGLEDRLFGQLSGGQKQRVLFALALSGNPDLIFLDEPTVGLDIESRRSLWAQIRALAARGKTVLLTTHYLEEADALASRIIVINKGELVCQGTPAQIKAHASRATLPNLAPEQDSLISFHPPSSPESTSRNPSPLPQRNPNNPSLEPKHIPHPSSSQPERTTQTEPSQPESITQTEPSQPERSTQAGPWQPERSTQALSSRPERSGVERPAVQNASAPGVSPSDHLSSNFTTKIIRCHTTLTPAHLRLIPGVLLVEQPPRELESHILLPTTITTDLPEATLREMLALDQTLSHLEVTTPALEDAFLALTSSWVPGANA